MGAAGHILSRTAEGDSIQIGTAGGPQDDEIHVLRPCKADDLYKGDSSDNLKFIIWKPPILGS